MKILIAGMGSIGSMLAAYLSRNNEVYCLGRGQHIEKIRDRGYLILRKLFQNTEERVYLSNLYASISELSGKEFDCIFICVKAYDLKSMLREIADKSIKSPCFLFIQNGLGISEVAREFLKDANIVRAITNNGANIPDPGVVNHAGLGETYVGGLYGDEKDYYSKLIAKELNKVGLPAKHVENIKQYIFLKLGINAVINPLTAILGVKNKGIVELQWLRPIIKKICIEIMEVAKKEGVDLSNLEEIVLEVARKTRENKSSMLQDIIKGKRTEIDYINGAIVRLGRELNVKTPFNELIYYLVKAREESFTKIISK